MARKPYLAGNWKMYKTIGDAVKFAKEFKELVKDVKDRDILLCVPFTIIGPIAKELEGTNVLVGAQNMYFEKEGAFTGEVSPTQLLDAGAKVVVLGHSERRHIFGESDALINKKVHSALQNGLMPILCVGELLEEREAGKQNEVVKAQIEESLFNLSAEDFGKIVLAYEPVWAIGTGKTATAEQAQEIHAYIRSVVAAKYGAEVADNTTILYGGSCNASNAKELFANPDVDGGLIGGASLAVANFLPIIEAWN